MHSEEAKIYSAVLIAAGILALILTFFIIALIVQRKKNEQLHRDKVNAEINALENERRRVAKDLHDEIALLLSVTRLQISCIEINDDDTCDLIKKASNNLDNSLIKIREIISDLMPTALERKGLIPALLEFFDNINQTNKIIIEHSIDNKNNFIIPDTISIHLFRVIQEIVHNSIKHAEAKKLFFNFNTENNFLILSILDNGKGFDQEQVMRKSSGLGLRSIISRVELLQGSIYLDTSEYKGVSYSIKIPLTAAYESS